jgi:hypothetical protein
MATDKRELILLRLKAILETVADVPGGVFRNRGELDDAKRPAIILLDGDEVSTRSVSAANSRGSLTVPPQFVRMSPEIYIVLDARKPHNVLSGEDLNAFRVDILKKIFEDAELKTLLGTNGDIAYDGTTTDMKSGQSMEGQALIKTTYQYVLRPSEL